MIGDSSALGLSSRNCTLGEPVFMSRAAQKRFAALERLLRDTGLGRIFLRLAVTSSGEHSVRSAGLKSSPFWQD
jgi:hypothetical protein